MKHLLLSIFAIISLNSFGTNSMDNAPYVNESIKTARPNETEIDSAIVPIEMYNVADSQSDDYTATTSNSGRIALYTIGLEYFPVSFDNYSSYFDPEIIDNLPTPNIFYNINIKGSKKRFGWGTHYDFMGFETSNKDEELYHINMRAIKWGFDFGLNFNSRRWYANPYFTLNHIRYRMLVSNSDYSVNLKDYNGSYDIRFNQFAMTFDMRLGYKIYNKKGDNSIILGINGGYVLPIGDTHLRNTYNRIKASDNLSFDNYHCGIIFGFPL